MMRYIFSLIVILFSLSLLHSVDASCSAVITAVPRPEGTWTDNGKVFQIYDMKAFNNGTEAIRFLFVGLQAGLEVQQHWNYDMQRKEIINFWQIAPQTSWSGFGIIVTGPAPTAQFVDAYCSVDPSATSAPTTAPTATPTVAATSAPTPAPTSAPPTANPSPCQVSVESTYTPRISGGDGYTLNITNTGSEVVTRVVVSYDSAVYGYNYNAETGAVPSIYNLYPGQSNTLAAVTVTHTSGGDRPPSSITPAFVRVTCEPLVPPTCPPSSASTPCSVSVVWTPTGEESTDPTTGQRVQEWEMAVTNEGAEAVTSVNIQIGRTPYTGVQVSFDPYAPVRRFDPSPVSSCISLTCTAAYLGEYVVLLPEPLCAGGRFIVPFTSTAAASDPQFASFSIFATNTFCY